MRDAWAAGDSDVCKWREWGRGRPVPLQNRLTRLCSVCFCFPCSHAGWKPRSPTLWLSQSAIKERNHFYLDFHNIDVVYRSFVLLVKISNPRMFGLETPLAMGAFLGHWLWGSPSPSRGSECPPQPPAAPLSWSCCCFQLPLPTTSCVSHTWRTGSLSNLEAYTDKAHHCEGFVILESQEA